ncbi:YiiX/YebB-like N1pC/P60 family cysteine hydrolase [Methylibium petroleiphilum]|uniref:YiiX/YebB-like N1pC/P60 family cysteine hydrolase n=1 Tax=Methylibium petroleiphilum TaxID=105560 RepID=UPI001AD406C7|nr:YiiX/YebB-like N1pC/P60 family cysteine hydrolase [Methylibium petroleiphilum]MBN9205345.1 hypothetical protein [Methylibium petroleiphilum]
MYLLNDALLRPGDIVLTAQDAKVSKAIRRLTGSSFSHAMLYVDEGSVIHSDQQGVHSQNTQRVLFEAPDLAIALRLVKQPDRETIQNICDYARAAIGTQYSVPEAIASRSRRRSDSGARANRQFCSRLVAEAYSYAGHPLVSNASYCYPTDLHNVDLVAHVPNCLRKANKIEIEFAKSPSPIQVQTRVTNTLLESLRSISGEDIQNEEQVVACLLRRPELDSSFTARLEESGYLDLWRMDVKANPWRYSDAEFLAAAPPIEIRLREVKSAQESIDRFRGMLHNYQQLHSKLPLRYFEASAALYKQLIELHRMRISLMQRADA